MSDDIEMIDRTVSGLIELTEDFEDFAESQHTEVSPSVAEEAKEGVQEAVLALETEKRDL